MRNAVDTLLGVSGLVGAGFVHYACFYILEAYSQNDFIGMTKYYPFLVEAFIQFKRYSRKFLSEYNSKYGYLMFKSTYEI